MMFPIFCNRLGRAVISNSVFIWLPSQRLEITDRFHYEFKNSLIFLTNSLERFSGIKKLEPSVGSNVIKLFSNHICLPLNFRTSHKPSISLIPGNRVNLLSKYHKTFSTNKKFFVPTSFLLT